MCEFYRHLGICHTSLVPYVLLLIGHLGIPQKVCPHPGNRTRRVTHVRVKALDSPRTSYGSKELKPQTVISLYMFQHRDPMNSIGS